MWLLRAKIPLRDIPFTHDIHSHILPGVDDGFANKPDSLSAVEEFFHNGLLHLMLTPHVDSTVFPDNTFESLHKAFNCFQEMCPAGLSVHLAAEYMCDSAFEEAVGKNKPLLCMANGHILIEMSYYYPFPNIKDLVFALNMNGYHPILAHPERYLYYSHDLALLENLSDMGCAFQLNLLSLSGAYGPESLRILHFLLEKGLYQYTGSDLHSLRQYALIREITLKRKEAPIMELLMHQNQELFGKTVSKINWMSRQKG